MEDELKATRDGQTGFMRVFIELPQGIKIIDLNDRIKIFGRFSFSSRRNGIFLSSRRHFKIFLEFLTSLQFIWHLQDCAFKQDF